MGVAEFPYLLVLPYFSDNRHVFVIEHSGSCYHDFVLVDFLFSHLSITNILTIVYTYRKKNYVMYCTDCLMFAF
jgi:hypothetical protein